MTLANMRANGVRSLQIRCNLVHHQAVLNVDRFGGGVTMPASERMVFTRCGVIGAGAIPGSYHSEPR